MEFILFVINFIILSVIIEVMFKKQNTYIEGWERAIAYVVCTFVSAFGQVTTAVMGFLAFAWCCIKLGQWVAGKLVK